MAVTRRQFLSGAAGLVGALSLPACAGSQASGIREEEDYLLPILQNGESFGLSDIGGLNAPTWFYPRPGRRALVTLQPPTVLDTARWDATIAEGNQDGGTESSVFETTRNGRRIRILEEGFISVVDANDGNSVVVMFVKGQYEREEIADSMATISVSPDREPVMDGWTKFELQSKGQIHNLRNDEERFLVSFAKPVANFLPLRDRFPEVSELTIDGEKVQTLTGETNNYFLTWFESDGLEVWHSRSLGQPASVRDARARFRRVTKAEWDRAILANPYPPPVTEPPDIARVTRDPSRQIRPSIHIASDFMADQRGEDQPMVWDISIDQAVPVDAVKAAMYRVTERLRVLQIDGTETFDGDVNGMFDEDYMGLGLSGGTLESEAFYPEGRAAVIRILREELAYAGVTSARISSKVVENR